MVRFTKSNRHAARMMRQPAGRKPRTSAKPQMPVGYFQRIGFDFAMI